MPTNILIFERESLKRKTGFNCVSNIFGNCAGCRTFRLGLISLAIPLVAAGIYLLLSPVYKSANIVVSANSEAQSVRSVADNPFRLSSLSREQIKKLNTSAVAAPDFITAMMLALQHPQPQHRISAINTLLIQPVEPVITLLRGVLRLDLDVNVRIAALHVLASIATPQAHYTVAIALADPDVSVRAEAINLLADTGQSSLPMLGQVLFNEPQAQLRYQAVNAIALLAHASHNNQAALRLLTHAVSDLDADVSQLAALELADLQDDNGSVTHHVATNSAKIVDPRVQQLLILSPSAQVQQLREASRLVSQGGVELLSAVVSQVDDTELKAEAIAALASIANTDALTSLIVALADRDPRVRLQIIHAFGNIQGHQEARVQALGQVIFSDTEPALRRLAVEILSQQDSPVVTALLAVAAQDADASVRAVAAQY